MSNLDIIERTRKMGIEALSRTLHSCLRRSPSEYDFAKEWTEQLRDCPELLPHGWYDPPPGGVVVLFEEPPSIERLAVHSFRPRGSWPQASLSWTAESLMYAYCSPVDRATGLIGDFALTMYAGNDQGIADHVSHCWEVAHRIAESAEVGMTFAELYNTAMALLRSEGLFNDITSTTDPAATNIGHTIPFTERATTPVRIAPEATELSSVISLGRRFVSGVENQVIQPGMAFTIEPRLRAAGLPAVGFHLIQAFEDNGRRRLIDGLQVATAAFEEAQR